MMFRICTKGGPLIYKADKAYLLVLIHIYSCSLTATIEYSVVYIGMLLRCFNSHVYIYIFLKLYSVMVSLYINIELIAFNTP